jgi:hypothetical protein
MVDVFGLAGCLPAAGTKGFQVWASRNRLAHSFVLGNKIFTDRSEIGSPLRDECFFAVGKQRSFRLGHGNG